MKMNTIVNESMTDEYKKLFNDLKSINSGGVSRSHLKMDKDGIINSVNKDVKTFISSKLKHLFDDNGICKLKFGFFEGELSIIDVSTMKSFINMPDIIGGEMFIHSCNNITDFDGNQTRINNIRFINCDSLTLLSNLRAVKSRISITGGSNINVGECFNKCKVPYVFISNKELSTKFTSKYIREMELFNTTNIKFSYLPDNLVKLYISSGKSEHFSFSDIDNLKKLEQFIFSDCLESPNIDNIITLLLCEKLKKYEHQFKLHPVDKILKKYLAINLTERKDHVMDCALELIDAGFPEAAEL